MFAERDRAPFWDQHGDGPMFHVQPRDQFEYRDRRPSVRFVDHQQEERYEERYYQDEELGNSRIDKVISSRKFTRIK